MQEPSRRRARVKRDDINKLHAAVQDVKKLERAKRKPDEVWFASTSEFDQDALNFAQEHRIRCFLVDGGTVLKV